MIPLMILMIALMIPFRAYRTGLSWECSEGNFETSPLFGLDAFDLFNQCDHNQQLTK
jgi:hypothetical protein